MSDAMDQSLWKKDVLKELEELRGSRFVVYFLGDRRPFASQIAGDAVRPLYDHLTSLAYENRRKVLDLFLYAPGGSIAAAERIVYLMREFSDDFNVFVPYKCHQAGTLLALGAERIYMGPLGELTPLDQEVLQIPGATGNLETDRGPLAGDLRAFAALLKAAAKIGDSSAVAGLLTSLADQSPIVELSVAERSCAQLSAIARKLLASRREKLSETEILRIVDTLTDKMDSRLHRITRDEAKDIGLKISPIKTEWEEPLEKLYRIYEHFLRLDDPISPEGEMEAVLDVKNTENLPLAVIESAEKRHIYRGNLSLRKRRRVPEDPQINVNLAFKISPQKDSHQLSQEMHTLLENLRKQGSKNIQALVQRELQKQSPVTDVEMSLYGGKWVLEAPVP